MRTDVVIGKKNEVFLQVQLEPHVYRELSDHFTFEVEGAKFMPQYRNKYWDGKIRLFSTSNGQIYVGLLDKIIAFVKDTIIPTNLHTTNTMVLPLN